MVQLVFYFFLQFFFHFQIIKIYYILIVEKLKGNIAFILVFPLGFPFFYKTKLPILYLFILYCKHFIIFIKVFVTYILKVSIRFYQKLSL